MKPLKLHSTLRRIALRVVAAALLFLGSPQPSRAAGDAAALMPILSAWQGSQAYQYLQQLEAALNQWATQLENLEQGMEVAKFMRNAYGKMKTGEEYYNTFKQLYYSNMDLISTCTYAYDWIKMNLASGNMDIATAARFTALLEHVYRKAMSNANYAYRIFSDDSTGRSLEDRLKEIQQKTKETAVDAAAINEAVETEEGNMKAGIGGKMTKERIMTMYGEIPSSEYFSDYGILLKDAIAMITEWKKEQAQAKADAETSRTPSTQTAGINSDDGSEIGKVTSELKGSNSAVLNLVCTIIGLLAIIMAIPAFLKVTNGQKQSSDVLYKLFMGTIAIIAVIQVFGRFILSL